MLIQFIFTAYNLINLGFGLFFGVFLVIQPKGVGAAEDVQDNTILHYLYRKSKILGDEKRLVKGNHEGKTKQIKKCNRQKGKDTNFYFQLNYDCRCSKVS